MLKQVSKLEVKGNEKRLFQLYYQPKSPLGEVLDALSSMKLHVIDMMRIAEAEQQKREGE
tara:strand:+ start:19061 stop:19240 length:180 start_codon:yes stop_codon:yes gene_type:complete